VGGGVRHYVEDNESLRDELKEGEGGKPGLLKRNEIWGSPCGGVPQTKSRSVVIEPGDPPADQQLEERGESAETRRWAAKPLILLTVFRLAKKRAH